MPDYDNSIILQNMLQWGYMGMAMVHLLVADKTGQWHHGLLANRRGTL